VLYAIYFIAFSYILPCCCIDLFRNTAQVQVFVAAVLQLFFLCLSGWVRNGTAYGIDSDHMVGGKACL
jgi:hypothetical protein